MSSPPNHPVPGDGGDPAADSRAKSSGDLRTESRGDSCAETQGNLRADSRSAGSSDSRNRAPAGSRTTHDYLSVLAAARGDAIVVATMTAARVWATLSDGPWDVLYLPSAMGHAADIALGLALAVPERRVVCVNGDGSLAMNLGGLITASSLAPRNLTQIVILNQCYQIVGGPPIPGRHIVDWARLADAAGWRVCGHCATPAMFAARLPEWLEPPGPAFVTVEVVDQPDMPQRLPRRHPSGALAELRQALAAARNAGERPA